MSAHFSLLLTVACVPSALLSSGHWFEWSRGFSPYGWPAPILTVFGTPELDDGRVEGPDVPIFARSFYHSDRHRLIPIPFHYQLFGGWPAPWPDSSRRVGGAKDATWSPSAFNWYGSPDGPQSVDGQMSFGDVEDVVRKAKEIIEGLVNDAGLGADLGTNLGAELEVDIGTDLKANLGSVLEAEVENEPSAFSSEINSRKTTTSEGEDNPSASDHHDALIADTIDTPISKSEATDSDTGPADTIALDSDKTSRYLVPNDASVLGNTPNIYKTNPIANQEGNSVDSQSASASRTPETQPNLNQISSQDEAHAGPNQFVSNQFFPHLVPPNPVAPLTNEEVSNPFQGPGINRWNNVFAAGVGLRPMVPGNAEFAPNQFGTNPGPSNSIGPNSVAPNPVTPNPGPPNPYPPNPGPSNSIGPNSVAPNPVDPNPVAPNPVAPNPGPPNPGPPNPVPPNPVAPVAYKFGSDNPPPLMNNRMFWKNT